MITLERVQIRKNLDSMLSVEIHDRDGVSRLIGFVLPSSWESEQFPQLAHEHQCDDPIKAVVPALVGVRL
jgi:hypothetical protein